MSEATSPQLEDGAPPRHVAIIMDGNHRWAQKRHLPGSAGHRAGARAVRPVAQRAAELGVEVDRAHELARGRAGGAQRRPGARKAPVPWLEAPKFCQHFAKILPNAFISLR